MAISSKRRNKLTIKDRKYIWYVKLSDYNNDYVLHVISDDKRFIIQYGLANPFGRHFITTLGPEFNTLSPSGVWRRFRCPQWDNTGIITPAGVRALIDWAVDKTTVLTEVDYHGNAVPFGGLCDSCGRDLRGVLGYDSVACCYCGRTIMERVI